MQEPLSRSGMLDALRKIPSWVYRRLLLQYSLLLAAVAIDLANLRMRFPLQVQEQLSELELVLAGIWVAVILWGVVGGILEKQRAGVYVQLIAPVGIMILDLIG